MCLPVKYMGSKRGITVNAHQYPLVMVLTIVPHRCKVPSTVKTVMYE